MISRISMGKRRIRGRSAGVGDLGEGIVGQMGVGVAKG